MENTYHQQKMQISIKDWPYVFHYLFPNLVHDHFRRGRASELIKSTWSWLWHVSGDMSQSLTAALLDFDDSFSHGYVYFFPWSKARTLRCSENPSMFFSLPKSSKSLRICLSIQNAMVFFMFFPSKIHPKSFPDVNLGHGQLGQEFGEQFQRTDGGHLELMDYVVL